MNLNKGKIFNLGDKEYIIVSTINYNETEYGLINEINDNEPEMEKYHIINIENNKYIFLNDIELSNKLIPLFQKEIIKDLKENNLI